MLIFCSRLITTQIGHFFIWLASAISQYLDNRERTLHVLLLGQLNSVYICAAPCYGFLCGTFNIDGPSAENKRVLALGVNCSHPTTVYILSNFLQVGRNGFQSTLAEFRQNDNLWKSLGGSQVNLCPQRCSSLRFGGHWSSPNHKF